MATVAPSRRATTSSGRELACSIHSCGISGRRMATDGGREPPSSTTMRGCPTATLLWLLYLIGRASRPAGDLSTNPEREFRCSQGVAAGGGPARGLDRLRGHRARGSGGGAGESGGEWRGGG